MRRLLASEPPAFQPSSTCCFSSLSDLNLLVILIPLCHLHQLLRDILKNNPYLNLNLYFRILEELPVFLTCPARSRMEIRSEANFQFSFDTKVTAAPERLEREREKKQISKTNPEETLWFKIAFQNNPTLPGQCAPRDGRTLRCLEGNHS